MAQRPIQENEPSMKRTRPIEEIFAARKRLSASHKPGAGSVRALRRNMIRSKFAGLNVNVGKPTSP